MPMKWNDRSVIKYTCYHGTDSKKITSLDKSKIQKDYRDGSDSGYLGWGFYLTKDKEYASGYGDNILTFEVDIENPFILGTTTINYSDLIEFLFKNSGKELKENIESSLYTIKLLSKEIVGDFKNTNSDEVKEECKKAYDKFSSLRSMNDSQIEEIKELFIKLAKEPNNWLNGLLFCFGKELFHYFVINGYDGVIADDGTEIVVYETHQIKQTGKLNESTDGDIDFEEYSDLYYLSVGDKMRDKESGKTVTITGIANNFGNTYYVYKYDQPNGCCTGGHVIVFRDGKIMPFISHQFEVVE